MVQQSIWIGITIAVFFVGNGLIMHNIENNPFWISYSVSYKEMKMIADK